VPLPESTYRIRSVTSLLLRFTAEMVDPRDGSPACAGSHSVLCGNDGGASGERVHAVAGRCLPLWSVIVGEGEAFFFFFGSLAAGARTRDLVPL